LIVEFFWTQVDSVTADIDAFGTKLTVVNLTDKVALYNFLSSFSGTHFVAPRTVEGSVTFRF
jgi:hypothetical protein